MKMKDRNLVVFFVFFLAVVLLVSKYTPFAQVSAAEAGDSGFLEPQGTPTWFNVFLPYMNKAAAVVQPNAYFVATNGSNSNPGTQALPWKTISKAVQTVRAGNTVYVRGGVYTEQVDITKSGTQEKPIRFLAYPGETPVIEGSGVNLPTWDSLLNLAGDWIVVSGFEVRNSKYMGIELSGQHDVADNVFSHDSQETGILARGDYSTVQNSRIWHSALNNFKGAQSGGGWSSGLTAARDNVDGRTDFAVLRNNTSWENWGEGVSTHEANGTIIEGNISHDNYSANIYISDTTNALCQGNFVYMTDDPYINAYGAHVGIMMGDEVYKPSSANNTVINNIAYNNKRNFFWWQGDQGGGLVNVLIANNTFVNSTAEAGVVINRGSHQNARFIDNLIVQDGSLLIASIDSNSQLKVSNNLWSKKPSGAASGPGDVVADPMFARGANGGTVDDANWYKLLAGSPAINKAVPLPEVTRDYAGAPRGTAPDLGAFEYLIASGMFPRWSPDGSGLTELQADWFGCIKGEWLPGSTL